MKDFAVIHSTFWTGETGHAIRGNADAQRVAMYAITGPMASNTGLYSISLRAMANDIGITEPATKKAIKTLSDLDFLRFDAEWSWIWVVEMLRFQFGESMTKHDNRVKGLQRYLDKHAKHPFVTEFVAKYGKTHNLSFNAYTERPEAFLFDRHDGEVPEDKIKARASILAKQITSVFEHYKKYYRNRFKLIVPGLPEWKMIEDRIKEGVAIQELFEAIDGLQRSDFHQATGIYKGQTKYQGLKYAVKDNEAVYRMINMERPKTVISEKNRTTVSAIESRMAKRQAKTAPNESSAEPESFHGILGDDHDSER